MWCEKERTRLLFKALKSLDDPINQHAFKKCTTKATTYSMGITGRGNEHSALLNSQIRLFYLLFTIFK